MMEEHACPKCVGPLRFGTNPRGPVGTCYDCWGLWIDTPHLNSVREEYPVATPLYRATTQLEARKASPSELLCPFCAGNHLVQQVIRNVEVEWCPTCRGIFLDKGERERLVGATKQEERRRVVPGPALPAPPPAVFKTSESSTGLSALGVGEVLAGLAEILFASLD